MMSIQVPFPAGAIVTRLGSEKNSPGTVQNWFSVDMGKGPRGYVLPVYFPYEGVVQYYSFSAARVRLMSVLDCDPEACAQNVVNFTQAARRKRR